MICEKCGAETPAPLDKCISCSNPLPVPVLVGSSSNENPTEMATGFSAPPPQPGKVEGPLRPGDMLGRYRIDRMLGSGGMGHVYKAYDEELSENVALKVIRSEYASHSEAAVRFKRELQLARQISHKNVVRIFDLGEMNGVKYISMQFIDGLDLASMMKSGKLPLKLAVSIARQVAAGLSAAHDAGVVHRDLKPANVMVDRSGHAVLMDFGLARSAEATAFTAAGAVLGTLEYMSPEQAKGETASHRSDIYALGLIFYEMFTGDRPFKGDTPMSRLAARVNTAAPNPRSNHPDLPEYAARVIEKCLERDPAQRYASCADIDADLDPDKPVAAAPASTMAPAVSGAPADSGSVFPIGTLLAGRYELLRPIGQGAMGMVYQAFDRQLTRVVALKTILPELAANPAILKRFKQEVRLAQKVTHKNVVRIFDMGEDGGTKFITMDFIDGIDLKEVITRRGKLPPLEAVAIIRQVCHALEAAHSEGVTHRDLKPHNIMMQEDGQVVVMDFGIARSRESQGGGTTTDAIVGTPEYMSPEQARSEEVDSRSDIFSLGLIFYELLTSKLPYKADSPLATMFKRTQEKAVPPAEIDSSVPRDANDIIVKSLERDRENRYQSVDEILADLEKFDPAKKVGAAVQAKVRLKKASHYWKWAVAAVVIVVAAAAGFLLRSRFLPSAPIAHAPMTVLVADFNNHTADPVFDGTLEPVVKMGLEGAGFITAYDRTRLKDDLGVASVSGRFDEQAASKIAVSQGLGVLLTGSVEQEGAGYIVSMKATKTVTGEVMGTDRQTAPNKDQVLFAATKLAIAIRKALGDDTSDQRFASDTLTSSSIEAVHEYAAGMDAVANGKNEEALKSFKKAVDLDKNFGSAYGALAAVSRNLGQLQEAEDYITLALQNVGRMTERERYRARGFLYLLRNDPQHCIDEYGALIKQFPSDARAHSNIGKCWAQVRNMKKALEEARQASSILPKRPLYKNVVSLFASYGSDFKTGEKEARALMELDPDYSTAPNALAIALLGQEQVSQAAETYKLLDKFGKLGASDAVSGLADLAAYEGQYAQAARMLEKGAEDDLTAKYPDRAASKYAALANTRLLLGQNAPAVAAASNAVKASKNYRVQFLSGRVFAAAGQAVRAQEVADGLSKLTQSEPQAFGKLIEGEIALAKGDNSQAIKKFSEANSLVDTWIGRFDLGRAYLDAKQFTEADSEFDRCFNRRGEALEFFFDDPTFRPTYSYFPPVLYYQGRVREGMNSAGFGDYYKQYIAIRGKAGEDRLLDDAKKRIK